MFRKVYIEITNVCNLKCKFCPETSRTKHFMSVEDFRNIINKIHKYTKLVYLHVKGEPLLHDKLDEMLKILEEYNLQVNITTNGTLIKDKLEVIKNSTAVRQINFSIHSVTQNDMDPKTYLRNIFEAVEELPHKIVSYRLWNLNSIGENDINLPIIKEFENYYNIDQLKDKLTKNCAYKIKEKLYINQDVEFTWPNKTGEPIINSGRCLAIDEQIGVLVDGTVVPCCLDNNGDMALGNIFSEYFEDIINKPEVLFIKKNFKKGIITCDFCKTCGFLKRLEGKRRVKS